MTEPITMPLGVLTRRLADNLREIDRLVELLGRVEAGYRFTDRLDEALLLVPDDLMAEIREAIGISPDP